MILYFSGTGNSAYVAKRIALQTGDYLLNVTDCIKTGNYQAQTSEKPWIIVAPTYAWQIPHILRDWLLQTELKGCKDAYFIMTCGDSIGNAEKYNKILCEKKEWTYRGTAKIVMPENYIAMFDVPDKETSIRIVRAANRSITKAADYILQGGNLPKLKISLMDKALSGIVNACFYPFFVKAKKFYANDNCTHCGLCEKLCPLNNIRMKNHGPVWGKRCTHCMACICKCPAEAIEYGKISEGKPRYQCPEE